MRRAWRDQIAVCPTLGSGGLGGRRRSGAPLAGRGALVVAASMVPVGEASDPKVNFPLAASRRR
jgi:hypothetical protein